MLRRGFTSDWVGSNIDIKIFTLLRDFRRPAIGLLMNFDTGERSKAAFAPQTGPFTRPEGLIFRYEIVDMIY